MGENSKIAWTHHTFNAWTGCTEDGPECDHCYARELAKRNPKTLGVWGPMGTRVVTSDSYWRQPLKWNRDAEAAGERRRVFCSSLSDVAEEYDTMPADSVQAVMRARVKLGRLIVDTPWLDWLLLTKRPANLLRVAGEMWPWLVPFGPLPDNVWVGTSAGNQHQVARRVWPLMNIGRRASVLFVSIEPLLGPIDLDRAELLLKGWRDIITMGCYLDWVIVGGESGGGHRPMDPEWLATIAGQCAYSKVPLFVKQDSGHFPGGQGRIPDATWALKQFPGG